MSFRGYGRAEQPLPGDIVFRDGALLRYELDAGWQVHDGFRGEYEDGVQYEPGDVVVRGGALWIATPELGPDSWVCLAGNGGAA